MDAGYGITLLLTVAIHSLTCGSGLHTCQVKLPEDQLYQPPDEWTVAEDHGDFAFGGLNEPAALRVIVVGTGFGELAPSVQIELHGQDAS